MVQTDALVTDVGSDGPLTRVALSAPKVAPVLTPGRFALADLGEYLRTPLFPASLCTAQGERDGFEVLVAHDHPAAAVASGDRIGLIGPIGNGFDVPANTRRLLLVAAAGHLPALLPLARREPGSPVRPGLTVALLLSAATAAELYPIQLLPPALEVHVATADGSSGHRGSARDLLPDLARWADCVCLAHDPSAYPALAEIVREVRMGPRRGFAQALVVPPMACGVGACQGCAVRVSRGVKLACTDGPVFDLLELR